MLLDRFLVSLFVRVDLIVFWLLLWVNFWFWDWGLFWVEWVNFFLVVLFSKWLKFWVVLVWVCFCWVWVIVFWVFWLICLVRLLMVFDIFFMIFDGWVVEVLLVIGVMFIWFDFLVVLVWERGDGVYFSWCLVFLGLLVKLWLLKGFCWWWGSFWLGFFRIWIVLGMGLVVEVGVGVELVGIGWLVLVVFEVFGVVEDLGVWCIGEELERLLKGLE